METLRDAIRFHIRCCFNRKRSDAETLAQLQREHGHQHSALYRELLAEQHQARRT